jgi:glycosyltransferase involved in cell wall biosynthesis
LSLIEGMAAGCPVIATGVGGVVDLLGEVTEASEGFLICERGIRIDSRSAADLSTGLIYLAKNEKLRASFKARGRAFVEEQYGKDRLVNDMKELYRSLVRK